MIKFKDQWVKANRKIVELGYPIWAFRVTVGWLLFGVIYFFTHIAAIWNDPNEMGDFLAGFFSPLAFMWLVLGYFKQHEELKLNTEALREQMEELSAQKIQLERQANFFEEEKNNNITQSLPQLIFSTAYSGSKNWTRNQLVNNGGTITEMNLKFEDQDLIHKFSKDGSISKETKLKYDTSYFLDIPHDVAKIAANNGIEIYFKTVYGKTYRQKFEYEGEKIKNTLVKQSEPELLD